MNILIPFNRDYQKNHGWFIFTPHGPIGEAQAEQLKLKLISDFGSPSHQFFIPASCCLRTNGKQDVANKVRGDVLGLIYNSNRQKP